MLTGAVLTKPGRRFFAKGSQRSRTVGRTSTASSHYDAGGPWLFGRRDISVGIAAGRVAAEYFEAAVLIVVGRLMETGGRGRPGSAISSLMQATLTDLVDACAGDARPDCPILQGLAQS